MQVIALPHKRFAVLLRISWARREERRLFLGNRKDWKGTKQYPHYNTIPKQQWFPQLQQKPRMAEPTKFKSPFKKIIQTRCFSWSQFIEFHLAHDKYFVWTASLRRRFADRKYSYTVRFRDSLFPTSKMFIYNEKMEKILYWKILRENRKFLLCPRHVREFKTVLDSGCHAVESGFQVLDPKLCQWNLDSGFPSLVGFRIL